jgi:branched-chain amino acid transport system permease protein
VAALFGVIIGIPALRLKGDYLAIITLGFGEIIRVVLLNIDSVLGFEFTYGASGLKRIPKITSFFLVFLCVIITCVVIHMVLKSAMAAPSFRFAKTRLQPKAAAINTTYYKVSAFALSAFFAGWPVASTAAIWAFCSPPTSGL